MASFVYEAFIQEQFAGFAVDPGSWLSINVALVTGGYTPDQATDTTLADIPGGDIAADGMTGTFPTFTITFNGAGATPEGGIELTLLTNKWAAVPAGPNVVAVVMYAILSAGVTLLIAYYDDWTNLPFTPDGTDVTIASLPTPFQTNGVNMVRTSN